MRGAEALSRANHEHTMDLTQKLSLQPVPREPLADGYQNTLAVSQEEQGHLPFREETQRLLQAWEIVTRHYEYATPWYLLPDTGFNVYLQTNMLIHNLANRPADCSWEEALTRELNKIKNDTIGFIEEYPAGRSVFLNPIKKKMIDGKAIIVGYDDTPLEEMVNQYERGGKVASAVDKTINILSNPWTKPGTVIVGTSPDGWTGFRLPGMSEDVEHKQSLTFIYRIDYTGEIQAVTVKSGMTLAQHEKLLRNLKNKGEERGPIPLRAETRSQKQRIMDVVDDVITLDPAKGKWSFETIIAEIETVMGQSTAYVDDHYGLVSFEKVYDDLVNVYRRWRLDAITEPYYDKFEIYCQKLFSNPSQITPETIDDFVRTLGTTVIDISDAIKANYLGIRLKPVRNLAVPLTLEEQFQYERGLDFLQTFAGCAGGKSASPFVLEITPPKMQDTINNQQGAVQVGVDNIGYPIRICKKCLGKYDDPCQPELHKCNSSIIERRQSQVRNNNTKQLPGPMTFAKLAAYWERKNVIVFANKAA